LEALPQLIDDLLLSGLAGGEVHRGLVGLDAELLGAGDGAVDGGGLEELLGRDAAPVQASAADLLLLDHGDVEAGGGAVQGGGVAPGASTDHDHVELFGRTTTSRGLMRGSDY